MARVIWGAIGVCVALAGPARAEESYTAPLSGTREQVRPSLDGLPVPPGYSKEQIALGDRVFHGEAAAGTCSVCHAVDARGTPTGNDLTTGMYIWGDGSVRAIKATIFNNMKLAPGQDGNLTPDDVDAVAAYIWALGRRPRG